MEMAKSVDEYIENHPTWSSELKAIREIVLKSGLEEKVKWGMPTYTLKNKNIVGFSGFKEHFGLWFFQGVFLSDHYNKLINAQEGKTKALRQMRFNNIKEVDESIILEYIAEAIQNQIDGKEVKASRKKELIISPLLKEAFAQDSQLKAAFDTFSLSKKREFVEYIDTAKRESTKMSRMEKIIPMIIEGIGLNDKYR